VVRWYGWACACHGYSRSPKTRGIRGGG
jgi:hypothetical protein